MMEDKLADKAWVTFCMSTYKRPALLKIALAVIARQTFRNFEVVISDNDPEKSGEAVVRDLGDDRFKYFANEENLGMIKSFNKSIERAETAYIVVITDDDPVVDNFLEEIFKLYNSNKNYSVYAGFLRKNTGTDAVEILNSSVFLQELLDPDKTTSILSSSCVLKRSDVIAIGKLPDYKGTHLADHALIAMTGSMNGGLIINKMYSSLSSHDSNFSKFNFENYTNGCREFYMLMTGFCSEHKNFADEDKVIVKHIGHWFIVNIFSLKRYYTLRGNTEMTGLVNSCAAEIMSFPFMRVFAPAYYRKEVIFKIKKAVGLLK